MPIYEYECSLCQVHFERKQGFDEEPVDICPECQGKAYRVIHPISVIFKGTGFYTTDSRGDTFGSTEGEETELKEESLT